MRARVSGYTTGRRHIEVVRKDSLTFPVLFLPQPQTAQHLWERKGVSLGLQHSACPTVKQHPASSGCPCCQVDVHRHLSTAPVPCGNLQPRFRPVRWPQSQTSTSQGSRHPSVTGRPGNRRLPAPGSRQGVRITRDSLPTSSCYFRYTDTASATQPQGSGAIGETGHH